MQRFDVHSFEQRRKKSLTAFHSARKSGDLNRAHQLFKKCVRDHAKHYSRTFPWRTRRTPYRVVVAELMLQQTQADRVVPKYRGFLKQFPSCAALARAKRSDVLIAWQGLGYNRRAIALHRLAQQLTTDHHGRFPTSFEALCTLPGIGPYTAAAVQAFAFGIATPLIETNIRTVYTHFYFPEATSVDDSELMPLIAATLDKRTPAAWYDALMDYGAALKQGGVKLNAKNPRYRTQSPFIGSNRYVRGAIVRYLTITPSVTMQTLQQELDVSLSKMQQLLDALVRDGLLTKSNCRYSLSDR